MNLKKIKITLLLFFLFFTFMSGMGDSSSSSSSDNVSGSSKAVTSSLMKSVGVAEAAESYRVTFVELGSVNCVPCKMMQPVMREIEKKYPGQVRIIFHDVWTPEGRTSGAKYAIRVIPTQVFLDKNGKEYFRHEGFFPFEEVEKILKQKGVK